MCVALARNACARNSLPAARSSCRVKAVAAADPAACATEPDYQPLGHLRLPDLERVVQRPGRGQRRHRRVPARWRCLGPWCLLAGALSSQGGVVASGSVVYAANNTHVVAVTLGSTGVYKMCHSTMSNPTQEHHFTIRAWRFSACAPGWLAIASGALAAACVASALAESAHLHAGRICAFCMICRYGVVGYLVPICGYGIWYFNLWE